jgi:hypothetical protein
MSRVVNIDREYVVICARCGRGILGQSRKAVIDTMPVWWTTDVEGPPCGGRIMSVERKAQVEAVWAEPIVPANEQEIL